MKVSRPKIHWTLGATSLTAISLITLSCVRPPERPSLALDKLQNNDGESVSAAVSSRQVSTVGPRIAAPGEIIRRKAQATGARAASAPRQEGKTPELPLPDQRPNLPEIETEHARAALNTAESVTEAPVVEAANHSTALTTPGTIVPMQPTSADPFGHPRAALAIPERNLSGFPKAVAIGTAAPIPAASISGAAKGKSLESGRKTFILEVFFISFIIVGLAGALWYRMNYDFGRLPPKNRR